MEEGGGDPLGLLCPVGRPEKLALYRGGKTRVEESSRAIAGCFGGGQKRDWQCPHVCVLRVRPKILMADSEALPSLAGDPVAVEALLRAVFGVVVDEAIQKGTSVSQKCHYSIQKGAAFLGLGTDSVRVVKADERGKMVPEDLERQIGMAEAEGAVPFLVSATSGTTVLGAFDPLEAIADVCQRHGLWLHVDAAWGGSVLLSQTHRHLLDGIQRADSVAWNPHKLLAAGLQCSALLLQDTSNLLKRCHGSQASYLFQQDKFYDVALDTGDKVVQCGRRVDCLKLWLMWKAQGDQGLERRIDQAFVLARYLVEEMKKREGFELVMEPEFVNVCFWFVPPSLRGKQESPDYHERLSKVAPVLKERMVKEGSMMIGYQPHGTRGNFFRVVVANSALTCADMDFLLNELERLGQDL
ncbi:cysteine sulfinic acid decarboxylase isoform X3 [Pan paniscus]|nr:cysteine sulfinic acid decarboxylase isoform X3 [Pan paniscus]XP_054520190.1 cysteine sulfinic acid decarboxylase isoform X3 [Pan troglodytes]